MTIAGFIAATTGKSIFIPGYPTAECVAAFWLFNTQHQGENYAANGACNLWEQGGQPYLWDSYTRITGGFTYGDWVIWAGNRGAYPNGGFGHVALYLRPHSDTHAWFMSQNPGPFREVLLSLDGVAGALRSGMAADNPPAAETMDHRSVTNPVAWVRTAPNSGAAPAPGYPDGLAQGAVLAVRGYVQGEDPYGTGDNAWYLTVSGFYVWANAAEDNLAGLALL